ncbi:acyl-CoA dehydrogenase family protein [Amycolatopsis sp. CA-230715]|uniref:acyl-CoA dehydrogenase family protein n=1 Tax=Amycolatopsis sp. CA-230715 TaxID=2745196 RepID=UPI001C0330B1|nr:acyl-CoA dehydrogenase family protein [Amycolatopsis sp. CA-230715]QWF77553.1 Acyl-CoA dehydrogenase FadE27 [Amycolatopsis sp. CA-230715]
MDFTLTEAQGDLAGLARRILGDRVTPETLGQHGSGRLDRALWTEFGRAGLIDAALPAAVGGGGFGLLEQCSVLIELGRAVAPLPYLPTVTMAAAALAEFGRGEQLERWLIPALRGEKVFAVALPDVSVPPGFTAERSASGWRLSGTQTAVGVAADADAVLVPADTADGVAVFVLASDSPGLLVDPQRTVDRGDSALVTLAEAAVPDSALLGEPGAGVAEWLRLRGTVGLCAAQLGVLERALELTAAHARERRQFDAVIGSFQAVRQRLADAYADVEAVRLTLWQAAWLLSEAEPAAEEVATAKFWAAEAGHRVAHTAVHVHGGVGIDTEHEMHRYFVAAKRNEFALGGATAQLRELGGLLASSL